jgi:3-oxoacyl-[acyl-carrier protein] reductase
VTSLAKTLSVELAPDRIRVNTLVPGRILTDRLTHLDEISAGKAAISLDEQRQRSQSTIPMRRYGDPAEFGRVGAFLLSDAASYITGSAVYVDGGLIRTL